MIYFNGLLRWVSCIGYFDELLICDFVIKKRLTLQHTELFLLVSYMQIYMKFVVVQKAMVLPSNIPAVFSNLNGMV